MLARLDDTSSHEDCIFRPLSRVHSLLPRPACAFGSFRFLLKSIDFIENPFESLRGQASFLTREGSHAGCLPASNILPPPSSFLHRFSLFLIAINQLPLESLRIPWRPSFRGKPRWLLPVSGGQASLHTRGDGHIGCSPASCVLLPSPESFLLPRIYAFHAGINGFRLESLRIPCI